jgi:hypothetical protein
VADDIDRVRHEFEVDEKRFQRWLDDDSSCPDFCVVIMAISAWAICRADGREHLTHQ